MPTVTPVVSTLPWEMAHPLRSARMDGIGVFPLNVQAAIMHATSAATTLSNQQLGLSDAEITAAYASLSAEFGSAAEAAAKPFLGRHHKKAVQAELFKYFTDPAPNPPAGSSGQGG